MGAVGWIRQAPEPEPEDHVCALPMRAVVWRVPGWVSAAGEEIPGGPEAVVEYVPDGAFGDLWRCEGDQPDGSVVVCWRLWRVGNGCGRCDPCRPRGRCMGGGYHPVSLAWRPARPWQRLWANWVRLAY